MKPGRRGCSWICVKIFPCQWVLEYYYISQNAKTQGRPSSNCSLWSVDHPCMSEMHGKVEASSSHNGFSLLVKYVFYNVTEYWSIDTVPIWKLIDSWRRSLSNCSLSLSNDLAFAMTLCWEVGHRQTGLPGFVTCVFLEALQSIKVRHRQTAFANIPNTVEQVMARSPESPDLRRSLILRHEQIGLANTRWSIDRQD